MRQDVLAVLRWVSRARTKEDVVKRDRWKAGIYWPQRILGSGDGPGAGMVIPTIKILDFKYEGIH